MENYFVEGSKKTPVINLNTGGKIHIGGRSIHEDPDKFFKPIVNWINEYCMNPPLGTTTVDIELEYFNSGSAKFILTILQTLTKNIEPDHKLTINWHYEEGDDDILERGEYYSSLLNKDFVFIQES